MATKTTTLQALARLEANHDFKEVLEHLQQQHDSAVAKLAVAGDMIHIGRAQGEVQVLGDFLKLARDAVRLVRARG